MLPDGCGIDLLPYARQRFPDALLGEKFSQGRTVFENDGVRMWVDEGDDIAVVGFKTKLQTVNDHVLNGLQEAIAIAERDVREGQVDTDNYTRMREVGEAGLRKRR